MNADPSSEGRGSEPTGPPSGAPVPPTLSARHDRAIAALLSEPTVAKAAEACGVPLRTLQRWLERSDFKAALRDARREAFGQAIAMTVRYSPVAVQTLAKVLVDTGASASARVTAAATLLKFGRESIELDDVSERLGALERSLGGASSRAAADAGEHWPSARGHL